MKKLTGKAKYNEDTTQAILSCLTHIASHLLDEARGLGLETIRQLEVIKNTSAEFPVCLCDQCLLSIKPTVRMRPSSRIRGTPLL